MTKISAIEYNGGRKLLFPGKDISEMKVGDMITEITKRLALPRGKIYICDLKNNILQDKDTLIKDKFPNGEVRYKLKLTTPIISGKLKNVTLDKDENHDKSQITSNTLKNNDMEFG